MESELTELEPRLKEILYRCLEEVRATKAALYLLGDSDDYQIATQYGFRDGLRTEIGFSDDLVDQLVTKRSAFFLNGLTEDSRFSEMLYNANTTRMLIAPVYSRGKLVGFLDLRDKAAKEAFDAGDIAKVQKIADQFLELFAQKGLYGQRTTTLTNLKIPRLETLGPEEAAGTIVDEARSRITSGALHRSAKATSVTEEQFRAGAAILPGILGLDHAVLGSLTAFSVLGGHQTIVASGEVTPGALEQFQARLQNWQHRRGEATAAPRTGVEYPYGMLGSVVTPERLISLLSAPVPSVEAAGLVLSVVFDVQPDPALRARLERFLNDIQRAIDNAIGRDSVVLANQRIAESLLEPDFQHFPALAEHCRRVADLCERLARAAGLRGDQVEMIRICGLVHDVGMRMLDYEQLYRSSNLTSDQLQLLKEHSMVGAAILAESPLGIEIARAVYAHHERPDGTGYPDGVTIEKIPVASRIVHICEAYDAMTADGSYQPTVDAVTALAKIRRGAGSQFDPDLAQRFAEIMGG